MNTNLANGHGTRKWGWMMFCGVNEVIPLSPACAMALFNVGPRSCGNMSPVDIKAILYTIISKRNSIDEFALAISLTKEVKKPRWGNAPENKILTVTKDKQRGLQRPRIVGDKSTDKIIGEREHDYRHTGSEKRCLKCAAAGSDVTNWSADTWYQSADNTALSCYRNWWKPAIVDDSSLAMAGARGYCSNLKRTENYVVS